MGGSSSSSDRKETNITTTTNTTMRDVGLTGKNAVDMAAILQTGAIENTRITASSLDSLMQTVGKSAQQLIGGASNLVQTQAELHKGNGGDSQLVKLAPIAMVVIAIIALSVKSRRK